MKQFTMLILVALALLLLVAPAKAQNPVTIKSGTLANSAIDTSYYSFENDYDLCSLHFDCDSIMAADIYIDYRQGASGNYTTAVTDSLKTATTSGEQKVIKLRSFLTENIPYGCNYLRVRVSKRASGNGGATKHYYVKIDGILIRKSP